MSELATSLLTLELFANVPDDIARGIVAEASVRQGAAQETINIRPVDYFVLIEGEAEVQARVPDEASRAASEGAARPAVTARMSSGPGEPPQLLYALTPQQSIGLAAPSQYVILDGATIDAALERVHEQSLLEDAAAEAGRAAQVSLAGAPASAGGLANTGGDDVPVPDAPHASDMKKLTDWLRRSPVFKSMALFDVVEAAMAMQPMEAGADWDIVREGSEGNFFYLIGSGRAEVWRSDPTTDEPAQKVAELGPGDSFGEEALLQDANRNATVKMVEAGRLWRLEKSQFDALVKDSLLQEIDSSDAIADIKNGSAQLVDCRYEFETLMTRIPGGRHIPLPEIRERAAELDKSQRYLVYCRSGVRSKAAAFLMRKIGLDAKSIRGGLTAWPYEVEDGGGR